MKKIAIICSIVLIVAVFSIWYHYRTSLEIPRLSILESVYGSNAKVNREYIYANNSVFSKACGYSESGHLYSEKESTQAEMMTALYGFDTRKFDAGYYQNLYKAIQVEEKVYEIKGTKVKIKFHKEEKPLCKIILEQGFGIYYIELSLLNEKQEKEFAKYVQDVLDRMLM